MAGSVRDRGQAPDDGERTAEGLPAAREGHAQRPEQQEAPYLAHGAKPVTSTVLPLAATAGTAEAPGTMLPRET